MTNYHVIKGAQSAVIKLANGAFFAVDGVLAEDPDRNLVVLKVSGKSLPSLVLADKRCVDQPSGGQLVPHGVRHRS